MASRSELRDNSWILVLGYVLTECLRLCGPAPGGGALKGMKPAEIEEKLTGLKKSRDLLCGIISKTTGRTVREVMNKTKKDSYFNAEEAIEFGLATEIAERI